MYVQVLKSHRKVMKTEPSGLIPRQFAVNREILIVAKEKSLDFYLLMNQLLKHVSGPENEKRARSSGSMRFMRIRGTETTACAPRQGEIQIGFKTGTQLTRHPNSKHNAMK